MWQPETANARAVQRNSIRRLDIAGEVDGRGIASPSISWHPQPSHQKWFEYPQLPDAGSLGAERVGLDSFPSTQQRHQRLSDAKFTLHLEPEHPYNMSAKPGAGSAPTGSNGYAGIVSGTHKVQPCEYICAGQLPLQHTLS